MKDLAIAFFVLWAGTASVLAVIYASDVRMLTISRDYWRDATPSNVHLKVISPQLSGMETVIPAKFMAGMGWTARVPDVGEVTFIIEGQPTVSAGLQGCSNLDRNGNVVGPSWPMRNGMCYAADDPRRNK